MLAILDGAVNLPYAAKLRKSLVQVSIYFECG